MSGTLTVGVGNMGPFWGLRRAVYGSPGHDRLTTARLSGRTPSPARKMQARSIGLYNKSEQVGFRNIPLYKKQGFTDNDDLIRPLAAHGEPIPNPPRAFLEPHLLIRAEDSLQLFEHQDCAENRFTSPSNGEPAYAKEARGASVDKVSPCFPPLRAYKYLDILPLSYCRY